VDNFRHNKHFIIVIAAYLIVCSSARADFSGKFRSYYLNRHYSTPLTQESLAVGGWLQYDSPAWQGISLRLAGYTSQGIIFTDPSRGGGGLLTGDQKGYSVLGQACLNANFDKTKITLYRQALDTPFLGTADFKMTPFLVEAYTIQSQLSPKVSAIVSHVTKLKGWTDTEFKPMSAAAGFTSTDKPVTLCGLVLTPQKNTQLEVWEYYCFDFMNVVYAQLDQNWPFSNGNVFSASFQTIDQRSIGSSLGGSFATGMYGLQAKLGLSNNLNVSLAFTSTNKNHDLLAPWISYPGFTCLIAESNDLAGEQAWAVGATYNFGKEVSASLYHTQSYILDKGSLAEPDQYETELTLNFQFVQNLNLRLSGTVVNNSLDTGGVNYTSFGAILNYDF